MRFPRSIPLLLVPCALLLAGCGVRFKDPPPGNEFFKSLAVTGDMHAGSPLTALVSFVQNYPVAVDLQCELRQGKQLIKPIGKDLVAALPNGRPKATPYPGEFSYDFVVDAPGHYKAECFTPSDEDNYIIKEFNIAPASQMAPVTAPAAASTPVPAGTLVADATP